MRESGKTSDGTGHVARFTSAKSKTAFWQRLASGRRRRGHRPGQVLGAPGERHSTMLTATSSANAMRAYRARRQEEIQTVPERYNILGFISSGTYGKVRCLPSQ